MDKQLPLLIVDDQSQTRRAISAVLHDMGIQDVLEVASGRDAVHMLETMPIGVVLSNWQMPGMTGLGLLRWVRNNPNYTGLPFLLMTGETTREGVLTAIEAGASDYLVKPFTAHMLASKVRRLIAAQERSRLLPLTGDGRIIGVPDRNEEDALRGAHILVVDDMPTNTEVIGGLLRRDYQVSVAHSGTEAMQQVKLNPPDLILLDVLMPEVDGFHVCAQLKADPATRDIPIIFLTAMDQAEDVVQGLEIGAVDYVAKPAEPGILRARIRTHLKLRQAYADLAKQHATMAASARLREDVERISQHDLKNPLAAIIQSLDLMKARGGLDDRALRTLQMAQASAWRAVDLVNQSLNLYKIETGRYELKPEPVDLAATLNNVGQETLAAFPRRKLLLQLNCAEGEVKNGQFIARADPGLCYSLFGNLLRNAAEASVTGATITVEFARSEQQVIVSIHNQGAVPAEVHDRFFEKYVSVGKSDGTGLGTYAAKLATEAQKGSIAMHSTAEQGTTLTVRLPLYIARGEDGSTPPFA